VKVETIFPIATSINYASFLVTSSITISGLLLWIVRSVVMDCHITVYILHEGWNFNRGNYLFTTDTK